MSGASEDPNAVTDAGAPYKLVRARHGFVLANPNDAYLGKAVITYGECCELEASVLVQLMQRPGRIVEVGANTGLLSLPLARGARRAARRSRPSSRSRSCSRICALILR